MIAPPHDAAFGRCSALRKGTDKNKPFRQMKSGKPRAIDIWGTKVCNALSSLHFSPSRVVLEFLQGRWTCLALAVVAVAR